MTIATTTATVTYAGTSSDSALATTFPFVGEDDLIVTQRVTATGVETTMVKGTDYTVTGGGAGGATGTVQIASGVGATKFQTGVHTWTISRDTTLTQSTDYVSNDNFPAESHEDALDKLTLIAQDLGFSVDRSLKVPLSDSTSLSTEIPDSVSRASMYLGFNASGVPVALAAPTTTSVTTPFSLNLLDDASDSEARATLGAQEDVITTRGDTIVGDSSGVVSRRAISANAGAIVYSDGTDPQDLVPGPVGSLLQANASGIAYGLPRGYIDGFQLSQGASTDFDHDIRIEVGLCADEGAATANRSAIALTSALEKRIDAIWTSGDGNGGMPNGLLAIDTWYHVFVIRNSTTGTVDAGFDTSLTAANLRADHTPNSGEDASGYDQYRRVGSVLTDGSSNLIQSGGGGSAGFLQAGDWFIWLDPPLDIDSTSLTTSRLSSVISTPPGFRMPSLVNVYIADTGGADVSVQFTNQDDEAASATAAPLINIILPGVATAATPITIITNTLSQMSARANAAVDNYRVATLAYFDVRGKT